MADGIPDTLFEQIYSRAPTGADRARLLRVKAALGLSDRDELWPVILTLDHYTAANQQARQETIKALRALPEQVKATIAEAETAAAGKADQAVARAVEKGADQLTQIVVKRSETTTDRISKRQFITAATIGGLIALICLGAGAAGGYLAASRGGVCTDKFFATSAGRIGCFID